MPALGVNDLFGAAFMMRVQKSNTWEAISGEQSRGNLRHVMRPKLAPALVEATICTHLIHREMRHALNTLTAPDADNDHQATSNLLIERLSRRDSPPHELSVTTQSRAWQGARVRPRRIHLNLFRCNLAKGNQVQPLSSSPSGGFRCAASVRQSNRQDRRSP